MNNKEKTLAIKIFDSLFGKFKISKLFVFPRNFSTYKFGLNCIINNKEYFLNFSGRKSMAATFMSTCNVKRLGNSSTQYLRNELGSDMSCWPKSLKMAVIEECLKNNDSLCAMRVFRMFNDKKLGDNISSITLVPAARSLEELAIKMELES